LPPRRAAAIRKLFRRAGINTPAQYRTWQTKGTLPAGATITAEQFGRMATSLALGVVFEGQADDEALDVG